MTDQELQDFIEHGENGFVAFALVFGDGWAKHAIEIAKELRTRLSTPEPEPVAWMHRQGNYTEPHFRQLDNDEIERGWTEEPLYTAPPKREVVYCECGDGIVPNDGAECGTCVSLRQQKEWQNLTRKEFKAATDGLEDLEDCWKAIEQALREKNNG